MGLEWTRAMATEIDVVDQQHRELCRAINDLMESFITYTAEVEVRRLILFLNDYVRDHFETEEQLMRQTAYPQSEEHFERHRAFTASLRRLVDLFMEKGATEELARMAQYNVAHWLVNHIGREDKQMAAHVRERLATT